METLMQFEDMKSAWQIFDRRLEDQHAMSLQLFRDARSDKARRGLRPLFWGQVAQILCGLLLVLLGALVWSTHRELDGLFLSGIILHVYGVLALALAGITLGMIGRLDYSAAVLTIQHRLARLRSFYIRSGLLLGLSWWLLWIPFVACLLAWLAGVNLYAGMGAFLGWGIAVGIAGLLATLGLYRWAQRSGHRPLVQALNANMGGASLGRAQAILEEIRRFERD
jgi:serine/threonine-protein kinase